MTFVSRRSRPATDGTASGSAQPQAGRAAPRVVRMGAPGSRDVVRRVRARGHVAALLHQVRSPEPAQPVIAGALPSGAATKTNPMNLRTIRPLLCSIALVLAPGLAAQDRAEPTQPARAALQRLEARLQTIEARLQRLDRMLHRDDARAEVRGERAERARSEERRVG